MAEDSGIPPLKNNTKVHPEPHKPMRGTVPYPTDEAIPPVYYVRIEGKYRVVYWHPPFVARVSDQLFLDLSRCVTTWEKWEKKDADE
jgi:hypothetical protein